MRKKPEDYLKEPYARILIPEGDGTFSAEILEFPGCFAMGETANDAIKNLEEAATSWIEATLDQGHDIPEPSLNQGYGGRIALRLPRSIHRRAVEFAEREDTSLNQFILSAVAARIGAEDFCAALVRKLENNIRFSTFTMFSAFADTLWGLQNSALGGRLNIPHQWQQMVTTGHTQLEGFPKK